jgi:hypothetical protein
MKTIVISVFFLLLTSLNASAQTSQQDSAAVLIIDRMSDVIGDLKSCSYKLSVTADVPDSTFGLVKELTEYQVYLNGSDNAVVDMRGHKGHKQYLYNGQQFAYYFYDENNYGILPSSGVSIIQTIDDLHTQYGIDFPAADFFYPTFTDDLLQDMSIVKYLGIVRADGKEYFHVVASGKEINLELFINNDTYNLPARFIITYKTQQHSPQYQAVFSNWQINPTLPAAMFDFLPPPGAREVKMIPKNN